MFNDKIFKVSLAIIVFLIILGFVAINFILNDDETKPSYTTMPSTAKATNISSDPKELGLETIFINIRSDKYKILKADIAFVMKNTQEKKALEKNIDNVRNVLLQYISSMDANKLQNEKGKERFKEELIDVMEESFGYKIETVYLKNFILSP